MTVYDTVCSLLREAGIEDIGTVQKFVGTVRAAGFPDGHLSDRDQRMLAVMLQPRIKAVTQLRVATVNAGANAALSKFDEIESFRGKNLCPRCKREMNPAVKLADYQTAKYCKHCKVTLWPDE